MKTIKKIYAIIFIVVIISPVSLLVSKEKSISPEDSAKIINLIYKKYIPVYEKYDGILSTRDVILEELDPKNNKLINKSLIKIKRKDYFYKKPEITVLSYLKNDKKMESSDFKTRKEDPVSPVFDRNGKKNYKTSITGYKTINQKKCYIVEVIPRKKSSHFFLGTIYCRVDNNEIILVEGSVAKISFPLKEFKLSMKISHSGDLPFMKYGKFILRLKIPLILPDRRYISVVKVVESKPINK